MPTNDGRIKLYQFSNIYVAQKTKEPNTGYSIGTYMYQSGDIKRTQIIIYENVTMENLYSFSYVLMPYAKTTSFTMTNITFRNITNNH